ncbi:DUF6122 family protein [uncultured Croceitalea sp.]|uniref:DUF6122 family protein n=1 Tax=uncultured Croceitalea sp. TaxID=1798908 RepID=UPI0033064DD4
MVRFFIHYGIHFLVPVAIGLLFFKDNCIKVTLILLAGIVIDLDHFLATPIFDPQRCSIGFHPLHSYYFIALYVLLVFFKKTRLIGLALVIHIIADLADCTLIHS